MTRSAIEVDGLSKSYRLGATVDVNRSFREMLYHAAGWWRRGGNPASEEPFWALRDVSFAVAPGEMVGVIGANGAGKSTLLKVLSSITEPSDGVARIRGRVGSLLEVGTGFHPELSGRENIYLNGTILGMSRAEIRARFDAIVDFAGVEQFLDTPVKRYSSGMHVRLAFAVAAHLEPEVLIVDEVLAVGDAAFQQKCLGKMNDVAHSGRTVLFVSHNMAAVEGLCRRALLLKRGAMVMDDVPRRVIAAYLADYHAVAEKPLAERHDRQGSGAVRFTRLKVDRRNGKGRHGAVQCGDDLDLVLDYQCDEGQVADVTVSIGFYTGGGHCLLVLNNEMAGSAFARLAAVGQMRCALPRLPLSPGEYYLNVYCTNRGVIADWVQHAAKLVVESGDYFGTGRLPPASHGGVLAPHEWSLAA